jgi:hypothetical protein
VTGFSGVNTWNAGATPDPNLNDGDFAFETLTRDGLFTVAGATGSVTISNLNASLTYDLVLYGSRTNFTRYTTYSVVGGGSQELQTGAPGAWNDDSVVVFSGLSPDANGVIVFTAVGNAAPGQAGADDFGYLNGMQLAVVPEPGTLALLVAGLGVAGFWRRRA